MRYLKSEELRNGYLYRIEARNAEYGIWYQPCDGFIISRFKFYDNFLFVEVHWDLDEWHGTVKPLELIEKAPFNPNIFSDWWNATTNKAIYEPVMDYLNNVARQRRQDETGCRYRN